jgi:uncharacterized phiE125 gp8 family phage protein
MEHEIHNLISLSEIKHFLRITSDVDDNLIKDLLETALFHLESYLCRSIIHKSYEQVLIKSKEILKYSPIIEIQSVKTQSGNRIPYSLERNVIEIATVTEPAIVKYKGGLFATQIPSEIKIALMEIVSSLYNSEPDKASISSILNQFYAIKSFKL